MIVRFKLKYILLKSLLLLFLVFLGISTKFYIGIGAEFIHNHLGGLIYVVFWILFFSIIFPSYSPYMLSLLVFLITCIIEFTQLVHNSLLEIFRKSFFFKALFGNAFNPFDFVWYAVGALSGMLILILISKKNNIHAL